SSAPQRRATTRIARSEYPDRAACTAESEYVWGPIFSKRGLLRLDVVAEKDVVIADVEPPAEDDAMGPRLLTAQIVLSESAGLLVAVGGGCHEAGVAPAPIPVACHEVAAGVGYRSLAAVAVLPHHLACLDREALQRPLVERVDVVPEEDDACVVVL